MGCSLSDNRSSGYILLIIVLLFDWFSLREIPLVLASTSSIQSFNLNALRSGPIPLAPHFSTATPSPIPTPERVMGALTVALSPQIPEKYASPIFSILNQTRNMSTGSWLKRLLHVLDTLEHASVQVKIELLSALQKPNVYPLVERYYAVVVPFDTLQDDISLADLRLRWQGLQAEPLYVTAEAARDLPIVLGVQRVSTLTAKSWETLFNNTSDAVGLLPFEQLDPRYKVLTVDGVNVLDNQPNPVDYPLATALTVQGTGTSQVVSLLQSTIQPQTNRDPNRLTTLVMTGVTTMTRVTAARMEEKGYTYPAEVIAPILRTADITHISNEVHFLDDCVVNTSINNLIMCSHTNYWAALEAVGTDIVGLSGNHVNDFGRSGARRSIGWYLEKRIPIYGSGLNNDEACAPLRWLVPSRKHLCLHCRSCF